ncbi:Dna mismatch repair protein msh3 [Aix galericulata]|nr:Dna mismatch repair protein msh3 [Aix galericulata]
MPRGRRQDRGGGRGGGGVRQPVLSRFFGPAASGAEPAAEIGVKRRTSSENNEPGEKKSKARQSTMDDIFNTLKAQGKSWSNKTNGNCSTEGCWRKQKFSLQPETDCSLYKLDDSVDVEEVTTDVPDNYLLCVCENGENVKDRRKGDILIGIMGSGEDLKLHNFIRTGWERGEEYSSAVTLITTGKYRRAGHVGPTLA